MKMVHRIRDYKIKFFIEHNMDIVMSVSERLQFNFGRKLLRGLQQIQNNDEVITAYLGRRFKEKAYEEKLCLK